METITRNETTIKTNCFEASSSTLCPGNSKPGYSMKLPQSALETKEQMLDRLINSGYKTILFRETSTMVRGCHNIIAYAKY